MKKIFGLYLCIFSFNLCAIETNVFDENYPAFQVFQETIFSQLRNYFEVLPSKTLYYVTPDGSRIFKFVKNKTEVGTIYSKITREISPNQILERVTYSLENGVLFVYEVKKNGLAVLPSEDLDLLNFKFNQTPNDKIYQLSIPSLNILMIHTSLTDGVKNLLSLGFMEFTVQTESHFNEHVATLNYIYFFKRMPNPQFIFSVKALEAQNGWNEPSFIHTAGSIETTPKIFFEGLNDGFAAFSEASNIALQLLHTQGFPNFDSGSSDN
jgi:hypothetical protein